MVQKHKKMGSKVKKDDFMVVLKKNKNWNSREIGKFWRKFEENSSNFLK